MFGVLILVKTPAQVFFVGFEVFGLATRKLFRSAPDNSKNTVLAILLESASCRAKHTFQPVKSGCDFWLVIFKMSV